MGKRGKKWASTAEKAGMLKAIEKKNISIRNLKAEGRPLLGLRAKETHQIDVGKL